MIDRDTALTLHYGQILYHRTLRNKDGSALRARVNGQVKTWKRDETRYRVPMKHGLRECFYIGPAEARDWLLNDPTEAGRCRPVLCRRVGVSVDIPDYMLADILAERDIPLPWWLMPARTG